MLIAWIALTCGIALGSWWAYYELGWGGFWFWDPVENASLMPWLVATALLHSALATEKSGAFRTWTLLLAIAGFSMSLIGTFLVRSGVLSSVHAFATDPTRGLFIMVLIVWPSAARWRCSPGARPRSQGGAAFEHGEPRDHAAAQQCLSGGAPAPSSLSARSIRWCWTPSTAPRFPSAPPYFALTFAPTFFALLLLVPFGPQTGLAARRSQGQALRTLAPALGLAASSAA